MQKKKKMHFEFQIHVKKTEIHFQFWNSYKKAKMKKRSKEEQKAKKKVENIISKNYAFISKKYAKIGGGCIIF